jgi:hypothetical protein
MLGLTRLGDSAAIESVRSWIRSGGEKGRPEGRLALLALRSTDAGNFGMDVLDLASQEPEGGHTMEAWEALGRMHTQSLARPALVLALSKKPHWRRVSCEVLHRALNGWAGER